MKATFAVLVCFLALILVSPKAPAYLTVFDNGTVLQQGQHRALLGMQGIFSGFDGANAHARYATNLNPDSELQFELGTGEISFNGGVFYKFIPFPDTETQPAIGFRTGINFANIDEETRTTLSFQPLISKIYETEQGRFVPYGAIPVSITHFEGESFIPMHIVLGTEWQPPTIQGVRFFAEYGLNAIRAYNYVGIAAAIDFDGTGIVMK